MFIMCFVKSFVVVLKNSVFFECESLELNGWFFVLSFCVKLMNLVVLVDI